MTIYKTFVLFLTTENGTLAFSLKYYVVFTENLFRIKSTFHMHIQHRHKVGCKRMKKKGVRHSDLGNSNISIFKGEKHQQ